MPVQVDDDRGFPGPPGSLGTHADLLARSFAYRIARGSTSLARPCSPWPVAAAHWRARYDLSECRITHVTAGSAAVGSIELELRAQSVTS